MKLAKVIGTVVCEHKLDVFEGIKFMLIQPLDEDLNKSGDAIVAVDTVGMGEGEVGLMVTGSTAKYTKYSNK
jgi:ethanolamine utilization protein EutN